MAERAIKAGFRIVKCAPFDEVRAPSTREDILKIARPGIDRVTAVRDAVGPGITVLVDCHSRFELETAPLIEKQLAKLNIGWFEEPVSPSVVGDNLAEIAGKVRTPVAGGESGYGEAFFVDLAQRKAVKTIMPDIKYCGGVAESVRAGRAVTEMGGSVSLHSPSGPISLLASAHATAAMPGALPLEHAVYEVDWRADVITPAERIENGRLWFPGGDGLGAVLNSELIERHGRRWTT
jgi:galactonate dehydratase